MTTSTSTSDIGDRAARRFARLSGFPDLAAFAPVAEAAVRCYVAGGRDVLEGVALGEGRRGARVAAPALRAFARDLAHLAAAGERLLPGEARALADFGADTPGSAGALARVALLGCGYRLCPRCARPVWDMAEHRCAADAGTALDAQLPVLAAYRDMADGVLLAHHGRFASALTGRRCTVRFGPGGGGAHTDMAGNIVVDPDPVGALSPTERLVGILGDIAHEVGHERHTPAAHWAEVVALSELTAPAERVVAVPGRGPLTVTVPPGVPVHRIYNIIEDGRMERRLVAEEPGAAALLAASCRFLDRYPQTRPEDWSGRDPRIARAEQERVAVLGALLYAALPYYLLPALTVAAWPPRLYARLAGYLPPVAAAVRGTPEAARDTAIWLACELHAAGYAPDGPSPDRKPVGAPRGYTVPPDRPGRPPRGERQGEGGQPGRTDRPTQSDQPGEPTGARERGRRSHGGRGGQEGSDSQLPQTPGGGTERSGRSGRSIASGAEPPVGRDGAADAIGGADDDRDAVPAAATDPAGETGDTLRRPDAAAPAPCDTILAAILGEVEATLAPLVRWSRSPAGSRHRLHRPLPPEAEERLTVRVPGAWEHEVVVDYPRGTPEGDDELRARARPFGRRLALQLGEIRRTDWHPAGYQESGTFDTGRLLPALLDETAVFRRLVRQPVTRFAVSILLDESGSMGRHRANGDLSRALLTLALALEALAVPYEVRLFSDGTAAIKHFDDNRLTPERARAVSTWGGGGTVLGPTARLAIASLLGREEEQQFLVALTDGVLENRDQIPALVALRHARQRGIVTFGVFLGDPGVHAAGMATLFGSWVAVGDLEGFVRQVGRALVGQFRRHHPDR